MNSAKYILCILFLFIVIITYAKQKNNNDNIKHFTNEVLNKPLKAKNSKKNFDMIITSCNSTDSSFELNGIFTENNKLNGNNILVVKTYDNLYYTFSFGFPYTISGLDANSAYYISFIDLEKKIISEEFLVFTKNNNKINIKTDDYNFTQNNTATILHYNDTIGDIEQVLNYKLSTLNSKKVLFDIVLTEYNKSDTSITINGYVIRSNNGVSSLISGVNDNVQISLDPVKREDTDKGKIELQPFFTENIGTPVGVKVNFDAPIKIINLKKGIKYYLQIKDVNTGVIYQKITFTL